MDSQLMPLKSEPNVMPLKRPTHVIGDPSSVTYLKEKNFSGSDSDVIEIGLAIIADGAALGFFITTELPFASP
eukprot:8410449-Karenia_brevis.AAC.1